MKFAKSLLALCFGIGLAGTAFGDTVVLNFENIVPVGDSYLDIGSYYNGAGGAANNYGVTFSSNVIALCLNTSTVSCSNASRGGEGDPTSQGGALLSLGGDTFSMNVSSGFTDSLSFFYSAVNAPGSVGIYSGADGTGSLLATIDLPLTSWGTCPSYSGDFCPFVPVGVTFSGTAQSVLFISDEQQLAVDDISFDRAPASEPGGPSGSTVPEPSTLVMMFTGAGAAAVELRRRMLAARA